jgi:hypothetical protein
VRCSAVRHRGRDKESYSLGAFLACLVLNPRRISPSCRGSRTPTKC